MNGDLRNALTVLGVNARTFEAVSPMLCSRVDDAVRLVEQDGWLFEPKLDGGRVVAHVDGPRVTLRYRSKLDCTHAFPEVVDALAALPASAVLDGEVCAFDENGVPSFAEVAPRFHLKKERDVALARSRAPVSFLAFDILGLEGHDLTTLPIETRRDLLKGALPTSPAIRVVDAYEDGHALLAFAREHGLEGLVAKRKGSPYVEGPRRTDFWKKVKFEREMDLVVLGWTRGEGSRKELGALEVGAYDGERLVSVGRVGSGIHESAVKALLPLLLENEASEAACDIRELKPGTRFVRPSLVVSVRFSGVTRDGSLRFPVFRGVRPDIETETCVVPNDMASTKKR